jgi:hypothetical protein
LILVLANLAFKALEDIVDLKETGGSGVIRGYREALERKVHKDQQALRVLWE